MYWSFMLYILGFSSVGTDDEEFSVEMHHGGALFLKG